MKRLDIILVEKGHFSSRNKAQEAIKDGCVFVNGKLAKASLKVALEDDIKVSDNINPYVSRAGLKLSHALKEFNISLNDKIVLDVGASTGGFTEVALESGAKYVYSVDVGTMQLSEKLKNNDKVISYEKTNILDVDNLYFTKGNPDFIVIDVSFVSIKKIIPHLLGFNENIITLIKPQFETGGKYLRNGVIRDKNIHEKVLNELFYFFEDVGLNVTNLTFSPIKGKEGNVEFLVYLSKQNGQVSINKTVKDAYKR
ncbi:TlyA family RNA methyltransferase [Mycoplasmatota bacterium WC44]